MKVFDPRLFFRKRDISIARFEGEVGEVYLVLRNKIILLVPVFFRSEEKGYIYSHFVQSILRGYEVSLRRPLISFDALFYSDDSYYEVPELPPREPERCSCGGLLVTEDSEVYCEKCGLVYSLDQEDIDRMVMETWERTRGQFERMKHRKWKISGAIQD